MRSIHLLFSIISLIALISISSCAYDAEKSIPVSCQTKCVSPYGALLGVSTSGVKAYSNCQSECVTYHPNRLNGVYTGVKWQCVEFARRWLLVNRNAVYGEVEVAVDIWNKINHITHVATQKKIPLESRLNGSTQAPQVGDLLIYAEVFHETGHVAVVTEVNHESGFIEVAEQNYKNEVWPGNYARRIKFIKNRDEYWLLDSYLLGWKHIQSQVVSNQAGVSRSG